MNPCDNESVNRYLLNFPDDGDLLRHVLIIGSRHRMMAQVQALLDESLESGIRADWDALIEHDLGPRFRNFMEEPNTYQPDKRGKPVWE